MALVCDLPLLAAASRANAWTCSFLMLRLTAPILPFLGAVLPWRPRPGGRRQSGQRRLADGGQLRPQEGRGLGALVEHGQGALLVRGMDLIVGQADAEEHQRRPDDRLDRSLRSTAAFARG